MNSLELGKGNTSAFPLVIMAVEVMIFLLVVVVFFLAVVEILNTSVASYCTW